MEESCEMEALDDVDNRPINGTEDEEKNKEKSSIMKNVICLSLAMTFLFTSYFSMENLQSSINKIDGTVSLATIYTSFIISSCFLPTLLLKTLKAKRTLFACSISYVAYMTAQLHPELYLLVPTAILLGLATGPLWAAQGTYITKTGTRYAKLTGEDPDVVITRFFSIFFMFFQSTQIWGNFVSSSVLSVGADSPPATSEEETQTSCGYRFCTGNKAEGGVGSSRSNNSSSHWHTTPPAWQIHALTAFYIIGAILASAIILSFLDPIHKFQPNEGDRSRDAPSIPQLLSSTFNHMRHPYQLLLIPLTIWSGIERAFLLADFTAAFVSCTLGVHMVGYTMICYRVCDVLGSMSASHFVRTFGRIPIITFAFFINVSVIMTMILWLPTADHKVWFFIIPALWGLADAIWMTQMNSLYGVMFPGETEPAYSNCRLWEATGFALSFGLSSVLCISSKVIIVLVFLVLGIIGYYFIEFLEKMGGLPKGDDGKVIPIDKLRGRNG